MIRINRFQAVLLLTLGLAVALLGCDSGSGGSNGSVLRILVTNDDGVGAPGIDAVVEALKDDPRNELIVSAPAVNQSGSGDSTTPPPLQATMTTTASGYPATAVDGFPADSVIYALEKLYLDEPPHVVLSGINEGQNVGNVGSGGALSQISGTVGAAKTAACADVPALASSQGEGETIDYDSGLVEVLRWLEDNRAALLAGQAPVEDITSINIPSCDTGSIRGRAVVPLGTALPDYVPNLLADQDCESTREDPQDDIEAFFNGYVSITPVPRNTTCPDK
jgi:5'-nucleotidase